MRKELKDLRQALTEENALALINQQPFLSGMIIFPAIDLRGGRCVRLFQGLADQETVYHDDPAIPAEKWRDAGSEWIHVVDLDGAFSGTSVNRSAVERIVDSGLKIQVGGGIRKVEDAAALIEAGVSRVVIGTRACREPAFAGQLASRFDSQVAVGIDAKDGMVAVEGWVDLTKIRAIDLGCQVAELGIQSIIYTDISRDGAMVGPNFSAMEEMLQAVSCQVVASGGVSTIEDVRKFVLMAKEYPNLEGIIIGKALYEEAFSLPEALSIS
jgi:phosphoribosylformimino-5-aminoimidazole carboxamide ribotide isomerase